MGFHFYINLVNATVGADVKIIIKTKSLNAWLDWTLYLDSLNPPRNESGSSLSRLVPSAEAYVQGISYGPGTSFCPRYHTGPKLTCVTTV